MTLATILAPPVAPEAESDCLWFLDRDGRQHRLHREGPSVIAVRRDGRTFRLPWPASEPVPGNEAIAARIFAICMKTAAES